MPAPLSVKLRERILGRMQRGQSPAAIAQEFQLCSRTVRHLCARFRQLGDAALETSYQAPAPATPSSVVEQALFLHRQHPSWGAGFLLHKLEQLHPDAELPSARTLQRWFRRYDMPAAPSGRKPASVGPKAERPHEVWQMDAVEQLRLQTGQQISWLRWVDECSGATLGTVVFPLRHVRRGSAAAGSGRAAPAIYAVGPA
jgi:Helix-turn-helix domain